MRSGRLGLSLLVLAAALAGCADSGSPARPAGTPGSTASASPAPSPTAGPSELMIVIDDGHGKTTTWRLTCDPPGGDHPDPTAACAALTAHGERALPPVPKDRMCAQVFGGSSKATVTGTWRGRPVNSRLSLVNGCEIARWKALSGLLPAADA